MERCIGGARKNTCMTTRSPMKSCLPVSVLRRWPLEAKTRKAIWAYHHYQANKEKRRAERMRRYYADPEKHKAWNRAWKENNRDRHREYMKEYRKRTKPKVMARLAAWKEANKDSLKQKARERYYANREQLNKRRRFLYRMRRESNHLRQA